MKNVCNMSFLQVVIKQVNTPVVQKVNSGNTVVVSGGQVLSSGQIVVPANNAQVRR